MKRVLSLLAAIIVFAVSAQDDKGPGEGLTSLKNRQ